MTKQGNYEVAIAGCGPVGAILALLLTKLGLSVCILEPGLLPYDKPRAIVFDWEAMRTLQFCGVAEEFARGTCPHTGADFLGVDNGLIKLFDPAEPPYSLGWPATLMFVQPELERLLRQAITREPRIELRLGARVAEFTEGENSVLLDVESDGADGSRIEARYLVGCDGAGSLVRTKLGIPLDDLRFDEWWVVVDAHELRDTPLPRKTTQYCRPSRPATFVRGPDRLRRWEIKILPGEDPKAFENEVLVREVLADYVDVDALSLWRSAVYRFHAVVASRWSRGRVFIAGDAAHQMPPFLGQGLCAGVRDAFNLAWKLERVISGETAPALLQTYEAERKPHVSAIVAHAKTFGQIIGELDLDRARERDIDLRGKLRRGEMETVRQKFIPDLTGPAFGTTTAAGSLFVQPHVVDQDGREALLDDLLPMDFLYVTRGTQAQSWLDPVQHLAERIRLKRVAVLSSDDDRWPPAPPGTIVVREIGAVHRSWCSLVEADASIVRPDRYVYATAPTAKIAQEQMVRLAGALLANATLTGRSLELADSPRRGSAR